MTPHPSNPTPDGSSGGSSGAPPPSSSASPSSPSSTPFHSRSTTNRRNIKNNNNTYYQPSVHQFSCRGAFHLQPKKNDGDDNDSNSDNKGSKNDSNKGASQQQSSAKEGADLEALLKDTFLCNGIQTKLRHVSDYPLAKSKEEAIRWFEGSSSPMVGRGGGGTEVYASPPNENTVDGSNDGNNDEEEGVESTEMEPESSFTSYGTTQVNILVVQEVPVIAQDEATARHPRSSSMRNNPFGGFGAIANPSGMLNPFARCIAYCSPLQWKGRRSSLCIYLHGTEGETPRMATPVNECGRISSSEGTGNPQRRRCDLARITCMTWACWRHRTKLMLATLTLGASAEGVLM